MTDTKQEIATTLRDNNYSVTKQRIFVFELLKDREALSMHELFMLARGNLDRASLYRIISIFELLGIVQRTNIGWKHKIELSDKYIEHHHHLTCLNCHTMVPISESELDGFIATIAKNHTFKPLKHTVEIEGYCKGCAHA